MNQRIFSHEWQDLIKEIGEPVEIFFEPRNEGHEWYVGLATTEGVDTPLHEHFPDLVEGLVWLRDTKRALEAVTNHAS
jgi:hypothetical protein